MTADAQSIAIAGAGIGGLSAALALAQRGFSSSLFERRFEPSEAGAGIQLGPNAGKVLRDLGVLDAVAAVATEPDGLVVHDARRGQVLARFPLGRWMRERYGAPYLAVHRQDLHRVLYEAAQASAHIGIHLQRGVADFENGSDAVGVFLSDGSKVSSAALVVADGLWSTLRAKVAGSGRPVPMGKCAYRTVIAAERLPARLVGNDVHVWLAETAHIVHYPVRGGQEIAVIVVIDGAASEETWALQASRTELLESPVGGFSDDVLALIYATQEWRKWPLQKLAPLNSWTQGAVALLGDAAHPIAPFFAQGGGLAIEDAAVLADALAAPGSAGMAARLQAYAQARKPRADRVAAASARNGDIYHAKGLMRIGRNAVLAATPGARMMRRYDWLYGWERG